VVASLHYARRTALSLFGHSAEAFSPVLYLRGNDSTLFDFRVPKPAPLVGAPSWAWAHEASPALHRLLEQRFTLVLGDRWRDERDLLNRFREQLRRELRKKVGDLPRELSMSALTQHYALRCGEGNLFLEFQKVFGKPAAELPLIGALARKLPPGIHITLPRMPLLELALEKHQPERRILVIQPPLPEEEQLSVIQPPNPEEKKITAMMWGRETTGEGEEHEEPHWRILTEFPDDMDPQEDIILLRVYRGYLPEHLYNRPLLTEDDYLLGFGELKDLFPPQKVKPESVDAMLRELKDRPALLLGLSMLTWHHRMLLHRIFGTRPLSQDSLVVLDPGDSEQELWALGRSLPGRRGVRVLESKTDDLVEPLQDMACQEAS
jgi:hypothetical protein